MNSPRTPDATHLFGLYERFRSPDVNEEAAASMFGHPTQRSSRRWELEPQRLLSGVRAVTFRLDDDVRRGLVLLDTVELELERSWEIDRAVLSERFAGPLEEAPIGPSADPRRLVRIEHAKHPGALSSEVLFELAAAENVEPSSVLRIKRIVFRRFYPDDLNQLR